MSTYFGISTRSFILSAVFLLVGAFVHAQLTTGDIVGTVTDSTGAVVPKAGVTLVNMGTQATQKVQTGGEGEFTFTQLQPGNYSVKVEAAGFKTFKVDSVALTANERRRVNAVVALGQTTETVQVSAEDMPVLQTESAVVQDQIQSAQVEALPLNGRNIIDLVQLSPGAITPPADFQSGGTHVDDRRQGSTMLVNGQQEFANEYLVDGLDNNEREKGFVGVRPSVDAIETMDVITSNYPADVSRASGAVINVITKAGTNNFHGSAFEYLKNDITSARDYFSTTGRKPELRNNQFGGSVGGPIWKNRTFFFASYEAYRLISGQNYLTTVPTLYEEQHPGDFTDVGGPDLTNSGLLNQTSLNYFALYPQPNQAGTVIAGIPQNNYSSAPRKTQYSTTFDTRIDHRFNDRNSIFYHFSYNPVSTVVPAAFPNVTVDGVSVNPGGSANNFPGIFSNITGPSKTTAQGDAVDFVHIFSPQLVGTVRLGYMRLNVASLPENAGSNIAEKLGVVNANDAPDATGMTLMNFFGGPYAQLGGGAFEPIYDVNNVYQANASMDYTRGRHTLKFGGSLIWRQMKYFADAFPNGGFEFANFVPNSPGYDIMISFLEGQSFFAIRAKPLVPNPSYRGWEPSGYVQDNWRITPKLTVNLGVRYEIYRPVYEAHGNVANVSLTNLQQCAATAPNDPCTNAIVVAGQGTSNTLGVKSDLTNISPRLGFAYSVLPKTVFRAGYSRSFLPTEDGSMTEGGNAANPPFSYTCFPCFGITYPVLPIATASSITNPSGSLVYIPPDLKSQRMDQWNVTLEQEFGPSTLTLAYVGEHGSRLSYGIDLDRPLPPGAGNPMPSHIYASELPNVNAINQAGNRGWSNYHGLQATYKLRQTHGLALTTNYTWSHALTNTNELIATGSIGLIANDPGYDYGNSGTDVRHRILVMANYQLPFGRTLNGWEKGVVGGWELNAVGFWQSGIPFTVINGNPQINIPGVGNGDRPNVIGDPFKAGTNFGNANCTAPSRVRTVESWFNPCAFEPQTLGTAGNEGMNQYTGPPQRSLNVSLFKNFHVTERVKLQFRAEVFNVTNTPNFRLPNNDISGSAGPITLTNSPALTPREVQFALRLTF